MHSETLQSHALFQAKHNIQVLDPGVGAAFADAVEHAKDYDAVASRIIIQANMAEIGSRYRANPRISMILPGGRRILGQNSRPMANRPPKLRT
jgi:hypothetical protein